MWLSKWLAIAATAEAAWQVHSVGYVLSSGGLSDACVEVNLDGVATEEAKWRRCLDGAAPNLAKAEAKALVPSGKLSVAVKLEQDDSQPVTLFPVLVDEGWTNFETEQLKSFFTDQFGSDTEVAYEGYVRLLLDRDVADSTLQYQATWSVDGDEYPRVGEFTVEWRNQSVAYLNAEHAMVSNTKYLRVLLPTDTSATGLTFEDVQFRLVVPVPTSSSCSARGGVTVMSLFLFVAAAAWN